MSNKVEPYTDLENTINRQKIKSDKKICFLPESIAEAEDPSKFIYPGTTTDLGKVLKAENIVIEYLTDDRPLLRSRKYADWVGPTIFIGASLLTENSNLIGISLNLISSCLYDFFKGTINDKKVKLDIVIERKKQQEFQKISY